MEEKNLQQQESQETDAPVTNKEPEWKNKARPAIYTMAGFYLAYLSWQMFHEISRTTGSEQTIMIVSSILFAVIGLTLTFVHILGIPLTGTSVNPARSFGPALLVGNGTALSQVWVFIVGPLVGAAIAAVIYGLLCKEKEEVSEEK